MSDVASEARAKLAAMEKTLKQRDAEVKNASQAVVDANRARDRAERETDSLRKSQRFDFEPRTVPERSCAVFADSAGWI